MFCREITSYFCVLYQVNRQRGTWLSTEHLPRLPNWLFKRNFNPIPVRICLNWIVAGLQKEEQRRRGSIRKMVCLWSLTTSSDRKSFKVRRTPRTKQPHAHMCAQAGAQTKGGQFGMHSSPSSSALVSSDELKGPEVTRGVAMRAEVFWKQSNQVSSGESRRWMRDVKGHDGVDG